MFLAEFKRIVKPGGCVVIMHPAYHGYKLKYYEPEQLRKIAAEFGMERINFVLLMPMTLKYFMSLYSLFDPLFRIFTIVPRKLRFMDKIQDSGYLHLVQVSVFMMKGEKQ